ncbi:GNAT family N-acetyltransferase [Alkalinema sp. FACHB-956]|uniref:GNAT family N-acetyltransferase n=1 Tax=Alkalinema sp. FACHB-956 TaxID=2692768 RepID=UPI001F557B57|nr:GNAT family N-acetyltransferase [Alkalinema sp. FACHB-956]
MHQSTQPIPAMTIELLPLTPQYSDSLWEMLMYAAHEPSIAAVQQQACLVRYGADWGRSGDLGVVAIGQGQAIGAVWLRLGSPSDPGFGWVAEGIPELVMGVHPDRRNQGIGTQLLAKLLEMARHNYPAICLNVRAENPAIRLYQRFGFIRVEGSDVINRVGGVSFNMICDLADPEDLAHSGTRYPLTAMPGKR